MTLTRASSTGLILVLTLFLSPFLLPAMPAGAMAPKTVSMDAWDGFEIIDPDIAAGFRQYDRIDVKVKVTEGTEVDVYVMKESEYNKYTDGRSFKPAKARDRIMETSFTFENPDDSTWFLVIDNMDNVRSIDAVPTGVVYYEYESPIEERHNEVFYQRLYCITGLVVVAIIAVTAAVIIRIKRRS